MSSTLYYGDNLGILREYVPDESVDLIYLDPPFNSKADYNILFKEASGEESTAQIQAFTDFWHWDTEARRAYEYIALEAPHDVSNLIEALYTFLGRNDMLAYLVMMGIRLIELHRVLKPNGSIYLHCDTTAGHYLKILMDSIFGVKNFRNDIVWKRFNFHADARRFGRVTDRILFYSKTDDYKFERQYAPYKDDYIQKKFRHKDKNGRRYRLSDLNPPGGRGPIYEYHGVTRPWRYTEKKMLQLEKEGRIYTKSRIPQLKRYLDELQERGGAVVHELWDDIPAINSRAKERLGYPTQKPVKLLERIIEASSEKGDLVLDPFCGCGTAVIASEKLNRKWIGIDITYLAINLVKGRLKDAFPTAAFAVKGEPQDIGAAQALAKDPYQFQWWALSLIDAFPVGSTPSSPRKGKKGADEGVDGWLRFVDGPEGHIERAVVQVKCGHVGVKDIRELRDVVSRQNAAIGLFITLEQPTSEMTKEERVTDPYLSTRWNREFPKIQILTIEDLLKGVKPELPPRISMFQAAPRMKREAKQIQVKLP